MSGREIKAIETVYNGYRFRSRLEARWAVVWDGIDLEYEYELEGFELPSGRRYLPDFWIPHFKCFVEVRPTIELDSREFEKLWEFAVDGNQNLLLITGAPGSHRLSMLNRSTCPPWYEITATAEEFGRTVNSQACEDLKEMAQVDIAKDAVSRRYVLVEGEGYIPGCVAWAMDRARKARFEFDETPQGPRD